MAANLVPLHRFWQPGYWPTWIGLAIMRLIAFLPYRLQLLTGRGMGRLLYMGMRRRRKIAKKNIALCFPELTDDENQTLLKRHFQSLGMTVVEHGLSWWASDRLMQRLIRINGIEHIEKALENGKGVLLLSGHFATIELSGRHLALLIPPISALYRPSKNPFVDQIIRRTRQNSAELVAKDSIRDLLRALKRNAPVWYAPDQAYTGKNSAAAKFFGETAMTNTATSQIARVSGAAVIPYFSRRNDDGSGYSVDVLPPLDNFPTDDATADAQRFNDILESYVRKMPEQYYWIHRRFKNRPPEHPDVYADLS
jgi:KDO2-lipid IV(A) lauroyltransferase